MNISVLKAQTAENDTLRAELEEIRVEAAHSFISVDNAPMSLTRISRSQNDLSTRPAATLDELTFSLPGVFVNNRENFALGERMTIRGMGWRSQFGVRGVQVLLDDMPLTVADGQTILNMVDPAVVRRVELLRGPAATFWGNSSGGVLHLSTKPVPGESSFKYRGFAGSYNTLKQEVQISESVNDVQLHIYGTYFETNGFRDHSAARMIRTGASAQFSGWKNSQIRLAALYAGMPKAENPGSLTEPAASLTPKQARDIFVNTGAGKNFDQAMISGSLFQQLGSDILNVTIHGTYRFLDNPLPFGFINLERFAGGVRSTYEISTLPFELHVGTEFKWQLDDRLETDIINGRPGDIIDVKQKENVFNQALFTRMNLPVNNFTFSAGLRADRLNFSANDKLGTTGDGDRTFTSLNPGIGITYKTPHFKLFTNLSSSFESPTTTELVNRPGGGNGFNQDVDPEKTWGIETGITGSVSKIALDYELTLFGMTVDNLLVPFQLTSDGPTFFRNEGKTRNAGVETSVKLSPVQNINLSLMYSWLNASFRTTELSGNKIPGVSPHRGGLEISGFFGDTFLSADLEWVGSYFADSNNSIKNGSYRLVSFRGNHTIDIPGSSLSISPFVSVRNVLNERFNSSVSINAFGGRFFEPGSDRSFQFGLQLSL
ncbi:MAG: TonB-dependent receptor family protein [Balneolaceae bacterium]